MPKIVYLIERLICQSNVKCFRFLASKTKQNRFAEAPKLQYSWVSATSVVVQCGCVWALGGAGHLINDASPS